MYIARSQKQETNRRHGPNKCTAELDKSRHSKSDARTNDGHGQSNEYGK